MRASPSTLRWFARVTAAVVVFAPLLAGQIDGGHRVALLALLSASLVAAASYVERDEAAFIVTIVGFVVVRYLAAPESTAWLTREGGRTFVGIDRVIEPVLHAALLAPLTFAMHRGVAHDSDDARDRVMLAAAASAFAALCETLMRVDSARYSGRVYGEAASVALGPTTLALTVVAGLGALGALVSNARWLWRWRRLLATEGARVEPIEQWTGAVPARAWLRLAGMPNDGVVVVGHATKDAGSYREGDVEQAITAAPLDVGQVTNALWLRLAASGVVLGGVGLLAATTLRTLRW